MKNIILRSVLCVSFFVVGFHAFAQDTIFYKTPGSKIVVVVKEVSQTEVVYKKMEMPDGPSYIISKNDIAKMVYKNGYADVMKESTASAPESNSQSYTSSYSAPEIGPSTISYKESKRRYSSLVLLIDRHRDEARKPELLKKAKSLRNLAAGQSATRTVGIVFGGITIATGALAALIYEVDADAGATFAVVPIAFGSVALISTAAAITFNLNLKKKRHAFVDLYNQ